MKHSNALTCFMKHALFMSAIFYACPAVANETVVNLPFGPVAVTYDDDKYAVAVSDIETEIFLESAFLTDVEAVIGDSFLLFLSTGGTSCPGLFAWVTLDEHGLRASEVFGTCSDVAEVRDTKRGPLVILPRIGTSGTAGYLFVDGYISEEELGLSQAGIEVPSNAAAWSDRSAWEVLNSEEMEPALLEIMTWQDLENVRRYSAVSSDSMTEDGDWFTAVGCMPHSCPNAAAGVAISRNDGRIIAASWTVEKGGRLFGQPDTALSNKLRKLLNQGY